MPNCFRSLLYLLLLSLSSMAFGETQVFDGFWKNTGDSFTKNAPYHLSAIAVTPMLIYSGADAKVHQAFAGNRSDFFRPGDILGYSAPFLLPLPLYVSGRITHNKRTQGAAFALVQSGIIALSTISILKALTGRPNPDVGSSTSIQRQSREFNFGFLNRGIYDGWPSGHMATISALASTLMHYYPAKPWLQYAGWGVMTYIFGTVIAHDQAQFHWFSDGVAGGLMGYSIGKTVGQNMRAQVTGTPAPVNDGVSVLPIMAPGVSGLKLVWTH